ncbi:MAG: hypothetical protein U1F17_08425 [Burkholderiaceae bacterium]
MIQHTAPGAETVARIEATQLDGFDGGPRFGVWWLPPGREPLGGVLCVQPLGDERFAARHALAAQAWRLAERGWAVLSIDLHGTGDSPGVPADATLEGWRSDLLRAAMIARQRHGGPNVLWGARDGALLAADIAVALDQLVDAYVFWQAPDSGRHIADTRCEGGHLSQALLADLRDLHMQPPPVAEHGEPPAALFLEFDEQAGGHAELSPLTARLTEAWLAAGYLATPRAARCARFWLPAAPSPLSGAPGSPEMPQARERALPTPAWFATEEFLEGVR